MTPLKIAKPHPTPPSPAPPPTPPSKPRTFIVDASGKAHRILVSTVFLAGWTGLGFALPYAHHLESGQTGAPAWMMAVWTLVELGLLPLTLHYCLARTTLTLAPDHLLLLTRSPLATSRKVTLHRDHLTAITLVQKEVHRRDPDELTLDPPHPQWDVLVQTLDRPLVLVPRQALDAAESLARQLNAWASIPVTRQPLPRFRLPLAAP